MIEISYLLTSLLSSEFGRYATALTDNKNYVKMTEINEAVLTAIVENPKVSTRKMGNNFYISHILVWRIRHDFLLGISVTMIPCHIFSQNSVLMFINGV